jgi:hypothetical protein
MSDAVADPLVPARFVVLAEAAPGLLSRLLEPLAKRDLIPDAVHATRDAQAGTMRAEMLLHAMPAGMVPLVAGNLGQVIGVRSVRTETAPAALAALAAAA